MGQNLQHLSWMVTEFKKIPALGQMNASTGRSFFLFGGGKKVAFAETVVIFNPDSLVKRDQDPEENGGR